MKKSSLNRNFLGRTFVAGLVGIFAWLALGTASAQDLAAIGAGKLPYVLFVLDTSGSTEWTDEGDERYPRRTVLPAGLLASDYPEEWQAGEEMRVWNPAAPIGTIDDGPKAFGPCFVWEPDVCNAYRRPAFYVGPGMDPTWHPADVNPQMGSRFNVMRGVSIFGVNGLRLDPSSQPRHVTLKEILAGQMVLAPRGYSGSVDALNATTQGPGCWFVRRQIGASVQSLEEQTYCAGAAEFQGLPDFDEPRPHFQEVISATKPNTGILKKFSRNAVFGVAFMDSFVNDVAWTPNRINDAIPGTMPSNAIRMGVGDEGVGGNYNLGVYRIATPSRIDLAPDELQRLSPFLQVTVNEAGMVAKPGFANPFLRTDPTNEFDGLGWSFSPIVQDLMQDYQVGKQPIARATPMAAAVADVHQFFANDSRFRETDTAGSDANSDPFARCRQKNVIMVTDGTPDPERAGGAGGGIGSSGLMAAFGLTETLYPYDIAENEIEQMVANTAIPPATGNRDLYGPRVHIISLNVEQDPAQRNRVADKLATMAEAGNTCASYAMPDRVQPPEGPCDPGVTWCLQKQDYRTYDWDPPDGSGTQTCVAPAVMLTSNDPVALEQAFDMVFGSIVDLAGTASRTKVAVTNSIDDVTIPQGGQYRFFSATETGGGSYWRGILNRQLLPCFGSGNVSFDSDDSQASAGIDSGAANTLAIHEEIADQIGCAAGDICGAPTDNRRIFTSVPSKALYDYVNKRPRDFTSDPLPPGADGDMFWVFDLAFTALDGDEFVKTSLPAPVANENLLKDSRVPFLRNYLQHAWHNASGLTSSPEFFDYWGTDPLEPARFYELVNTYRGRIDTKASVSPPRVLGAIINSDPVTVEPPGLDLPIESYRAFRARYGDRPTMIYFSTTDGLLHAVHAGSLNQRIRIRDKATGKGGDSDATGTEGAAQQREAWAYVPHMLHRRLAPTVASQPYLLDGPPTVKDVRLCQKRARENQNRRACGVLDNSPNGTLTAEQQWRTVLVQGLGGAGQGYFAVDITRPGGLRPAETSRTLDNPDPIPLWEFDRNWEKQQIDYLGSMGTAFNRVGPDSSVIDDSTTDDNAVLVDADGDGINDTECKDAAPVWEQALLGTSISKPEIATVQVKSSLGGTTVIRQRPIAVFGGGDLPDIQPACGASVSGQAIYVVDLQTGTLLRRFVDYDDGGTRHTFHRAERNDGTAAPPEPVSFAGSPALFNAFTGAVATRGFIGGSNGMLFRIDFSEPNPALWDVSLFYNPYNVSEIMAQARDVDGNAIPLGTAGFKPAIARAPDKTLVVTYGLGDPSETTQPGRAQAVISVNETTPFGPGALRWFEVFPEGEKMTGDPLIFNRTTYFPTYAVPDADLCEAGKSKIWALDYFESQGTNAPVGKWNDSQFTGADVVVDTDDKWFELNQKTLIRGLTLTAGPACSVRGLGTNAQDSSGLEGADAQPQLLAQTSGAVAGGDLDEARGAGTDAVSRIAVDLEKPRSMTVPLSWSVIGN